MLIYKATNKINGKVYIGQTRCSLTKRRNEHCQDAKHHRDNCRRFCHAIRKYGPKNFEWEVIYESNNKKDIDEEEEFYINQYKNRERYNVLDSVYDIYERTPQIRKKISETQKRKWRDGEYISKRGVPKHSDETKAALGVQSKKRFEDSKYKKNAIEVLSRFWGRIPSEETRIKMSDKARQRSRDKFGRFIKENTK